MPRAVQPPPRPLRWREGRSAAGSSRSSLQGLAGTDLPEPQVGASPPCWLHPCTVLGAVLVDVRPQRCGPQGGKQRGVGAVEGHGLDVGGHSTTVRLTAWRAHPILTLLREPRTAPNHRRAGGSAGLATQWVASRPTARELSGRRLAVSSAWRTLERGGPRRCVHNEVPGAVGAAARGAGDHGSENPRAAPRLGSWLSGSLARLPTATKPFRARSSPLSRRRTPAR